jgi:hypothetical protein
MNRETPKVKSYPLLQVDTVKVDWHEVQESGCKQTLCRYLYKSRHNLALINNQWYE